MSLRHKTALAAFLFLITLPAIADIPRGNGSVWFTPSVPYYGNWYFQASRPDDGTQVWRTDGTEGGTRPFTDFLGGSSVGPKVVDTKLFFRHSTTNPPETLYVSDGTIAGTKPLAAIPGTFWDWGSTHDVLYIVSRDDKKQLTYFMRSDGTPEGTSVIREFGANAYAYSLGSRGNIFYFHVGSAIDETLSGIWRSDGTTEGTFRLLEPSIGRTDLRKAQVIGDAYLFDRDDQVWMSDGSIAGTRALFPAPSSVIGYAGAKVYVWVAGELRTITGIDGPSTFVANMERPTASAEVMNRLFLLRDESPRFLGITDGTTAGTNVFAIPSARFSHTLEVAGSFAFFQRASEHGTELWRTDGTEQGTTMVKDILPGSFGSGPGDFVSIGDRVLFSADDGRHGREPWITDGTAEGTRMLANLNTELTIRGTVTDAQTGAPLPNAVVQLWDCYWSSGPGCSGTDFPVDANGNYAIEDLASGGGYWLTARTPDGPYISQNWQGQDCQPCDPRQGTKISDTPGVTMNDIDFALRRSGRFLGRITNAKGAPVAGVEVLVAKTFGATPVARAISRTNGTYETSAPIPYTESFLVYTTDRAGYSGVIYPSTSCAAGCESTSTGTRFHVAAGSTERRIDFTVKPWGTIQGRLLDGITGKTAVLAGSAVIVRAGGINAILNGGQYTLSLPDGRHQLVFLPATETSPYRTTVRETPVSATPGQTTTGFDLSLVPIGGRIEGRVTDRRTAAPTAGIVVRIVNQSGLGVAAVVTDSNGFYECPPRLLPERYSVEATGRAPWFASTIEGIEVVGQEVRSGVDLQLDRHALIIGLVRDATTFKSLADVQLEFQNVDPLGTGAGADANSRGRFTTPGLRAGTYTVTARRSGWKTTTTTATVTAGSTAQLLIAMAAEPNPTITIRQR
ncbi:MAG TPA: carboxypeptidase regulatory-like domain-containing protein [Thermoanaerobaculia bacterium]|jgi:ELWxxDGT repeat protein|nr:carboxypeptidase regulatory-like domain-containing protein [Thermoanaerobaculia bacterium]